MLDVGGVLTRGVPTYVPMYLCQPRKAVKGTDMTKRGHSQIRNGE